MSEVLWVDVRSAGRLFASLSGLSPRVAAAAEEGLKKGGMQIIADAQRNMRTAGHNGATLNATGRLSQSGRVQKAQDGSLDVGFFSGDSETGYAAHVEYGTRAHWPPRWALRAWVRKKLRVAEKDADAAAARVAWGISRHGTAPHPFFQPAVNKNHQALVKAVQDAVAQMTDK